MRKLDDGQIWILEALVQSLVIEDLQAWWVASTSRALRTSLAPVLARAIKERCPTTDHHSLVSTMLRAAYHREPCACVIVTRSDLPRDVVRLKPQPWLSIPETAVRRVVLVIQNELLETDFDPASEDEEEDQGEAEDEEADQGEAEDEEEDQGEAEDEEADQGEAEDEEEDQGEAEEEEGAGVVELVPIAHSSNSTKFHVIPLVDLFFKAPIENRKWTAERIDNTALTTTSRLISPPWAVSEKAEEATSGMSQPSEFNQCARSAAESSGEQLTASSNSTSSDSGSKKGVPGRVVLRRVKVPDHSKRLDESFNRNLVSSATMRWNSYGEAYVFDADFKKLYSRLPSGVRLAISSERTHVCMLPWQES